MRSLDRLDFQQPRRLGFWGARSSPRERALAALAMGLGLFALGASSWLWWQSLQRGQSLHRETSDLLGQLEDRMVQVPQSIQPRVSAQEIAQRARAIHQLNIPWAVIFSTLEAKTPEGVALVSLEPASNGVIRIQSESLSLDQLLEHAASLQAHGPFGDLVYTRHEMNDRNPNRPIRLNFELTLTEETTP